MGWSALFLLLLKTLHFVAIFAVYGDNTSSLVSDKELTLALVKADASDVLTDLPVYLLEDTG